MIKVAFAKMHGCGNDFMVIDGVHQQLELTSKQIQQLSARHTGIGFDQLLLVQKSNHPIAKFKYRIFNADGTEVQQCGNGARCFAVFLRRQNLTSEESVWVETKSGLLHLLIHADGQVTVDMGMPQFSPDQIPSTFPKELPEYSFKAFKDTLYFSTVSMGNPHCVMFLDEVDTVDLELLAKTITSTECFPEGFNLGVATIYSPSKIRLRVHERGVGETLACGSGACAAVVAGIRLKSLNNTVEVTLTGGKLLISWEGIGTTVKMTGPATHVFDGTIYL